MNLGNNLHYFLLSGYLSNLYNLDSCCTSVICSVMNNCTTIFLPILLFGRHHLGFYSPVVVPLVCVVLEVAVAHMLGAPLVNAIRMFLHYLCVNCMGKYLVQTTFSVGT